MKRGDTLYEIALDHGLDYRELAAWNDIENVNLIRVGQMLRLAAPGETRAGRGRRHDDAAAQRAAARRGRRAAAAVAAGHAARRARRAQHRQLQDAAEGA